ncbi:MAG: PAS domain S-box protein [Spirochaetia bacterium]|nr:PAS domain S-box protein [Spirochaetia bacterium]
MNCKEAKGKNLNELFHLINADTREIVDNPAEKVIQTGEIVGLAKHTVLISKDGHEYQIADSAAPIKDDEGNTSGVVLVFRDVTEEYRKDRQLQERVKELDCLYKIVEIVEKPNISLDKILQQTAEAIPHSWQYPDICECRITLDGERFQTSNFFDTKWKLSSDIIVKDVVSGKVEVSYLNETLTIYEGPFLKEERKLINAIAEHLGRVIERKQAEEKLRSIEWMLSNKTTSEGEYIPEYGDLSELNKDGLILHSVGKEQLKDTASEYLDLLETSTAIYEKNGDYALGVFTSGWCQLMDSASRRLCNNKGNKEALESGKWLCHESCWEDAALAMEEDRPVEIECHGGIRMYAVPIRADGEVVGAVNFGYGSPPTDEEELRTLSQKYNIPIDELKQKARGYKPRPQFLIDYAKERIQIVSKNLGHLIERERQKKEIEQERVFLSSVLDTIEEAIIICDESGRINRFNEAARRLHGLPEVPIPSHRWADYYDLYTPDGTEALQEEDVPLFRAFKGEDVKEQKFSSNPKTVSHDY